LNWIVVFVSDDDLNGFAGSFIGNVLMEGGRKTAIDHSRDDFAGREVEVLEH
jgi:hypothetical protein